MSHDLNVDCLNEVFEYFRHDKTTLHSCLLVNHRWSEASVRFLWWDVLSSENIYSTCVLSKIAGTLFACLPNESKNLLHKNGIFIEAPTQKPPMFNYVSFCKVLSIHDIEQLILNDDVNDLNYELYEKYLLPEILKMLMNQISSLKSLDYKDYKDSAQTTFVSFPGAKSCLKDLAELRCYSDARCEFFNQLSQISYNIQSLTICFKEIMRCGLVNLISLQKNLKSVTLLNFFESKNATEVIISKLTKCSSTIISLKVQKFNISLSFISIFANLQELSLSLDCENEIMSFYELQYVTFSQLKVLKFTRKIPKPAVLIRFLEINGKSLKELYVKESDGSLNLAIAKFCPDLRTLFTTFMNDEVETLKKILIDCQDLESINIWAAHGHKYLNEKEFLGILGKYSPKHFCEIRIDCFRTATLRILPEELEEFFMNWKNRILQKQLSLIIIENCASGFSSESWEVIKKYEKLGFIKEVICKTIDHDDIFYD